ncbi:hypothetical protein IW261DRAFT_1579413 [Armillaria novae-zelandiae]|uniref:Uncharacterized protein n=1 Tax=Armillaria novae-zelandiae TaxID=153914 RepID=A0AA39KCN9_9AGAR|nr:hypothetical protein IW261DRAFT_1579413 [Armillaria novae-zelandiae]
MPAPAQCHPHKVSSTQPTLISKPVAPSKLAAKPQSKPVSATAKPATKATKSIKCCRQIVHSRSPSPADIKPVLHKTDEESEEEQYDEDTVDEDKEDLDVEDAVEGEEGVIFSKDKVTTGKQQCKGKEQSRSDRKRNKPRNDDEFSLKCMQQLWLFHSLGRYIPCCANPFVEVEDMIFDVLEHEGPYVASLSLLFASVMPYLYSQRLISPAELPAVTWLEQAYKSFSSFFMPQANTDEAFALFGNREFGLCKMIEVLHNGAKDCCRDTTSKVCHVVLTLSLKDRHVDWLSLPVPTVKSSQGFNHIDTSRLLCPQIHLEDFNKDPNKILQQLADGDIQPTASEWPSFMYDQDLYDKNNMFSGLINGDPMKQSGLKQATLMKLFGIKKITSHHIAYAACLTQFGLCSKDAWQLCDGAFHLDVLYYAVVDLFEMFPEEKWVTETLAWWNIEIFDDPNGCADTLDAQKDVHPPDSTVSQMQVIFAEWHHAKEEAAAATEGFEYLEDEYEAPLMTIFQ